MKVTEDGKPVQNLAVLSGAAAAGIGTVLMIDASNSMKGSIDSAMAAARAFAARNPGQPLSVVFFNAKPTVALPLTTDRAQVKKVLAKAPKLAEGTHIYDALAAAVAQVRGSGLGAARIVLLSDGDDVGSVTSLDSALEQLKAENIRVYTRRDRVERLHAGRSRADRRRHRRLVRSSAHRRPHSRRSTTSSASSSATSTCCGTARQRSLTRTSTSNVTLSGAEPVSFSYTSPSTGSAVPYKAAFRDKLLQSWLLLPLIVLLVIALVVFALRSIWSLRSNKALVARLGEFVTLPAEEHAAERRHEVDMLLAAVGQQKRRKRNWRWLEGFARGRRRRHRSSGIRAGCCGSPWCSRLAIGLVVGALVHPIWFVLAAVPPVVLNLYVRNRARKVSDGSSASSCPRISTSSRRLFVRGTASRARWVSSRTRRPSRPSASSAAS